MHLFNALGVAENPDAEGFHNIILNVLQVVLVDAPVLLPHAFPQIEPNLPLKLDTLIKYHICMPIISNTVFL